MSEPRYWIELMRDGRFQLKERGVGWRYRSDHLSHIESMALTDGIDALELRDALSAWKAEQQEGTSGNGNEP